jgi:hypothetical protein
VVRALDDHTCALADEAQRLLLPDDAISIAPRAERQDQAVARLEGFEPNTQGN